MDRENHNTDTAIAQALLHTEKGKVISIHQDQLIIQSFGINHKYI